jgi:hypothetical protein
MAVLYLYRRRRLFFATAVIYVFGHHPTTAVSFSDATAVIGSFFIPDATGVVVSFSDATAVLVSFSFLPLLASSVSDAWRRCPLFLPLPPSFLFDLLCSVPFVSVEIG